MLTEAERELLLICARQTLPLDRASRARELIRAQLRWRELSETAWRHGVAPLLFYHLQTLGEDTPAAGPIHLLRQMYVRSVFRNRTHFEAIASMSQRLADGGVPFLLLKGAALAPTIYRDPALRPFADIDVLVAEDDVDEAKRILVDSGYELAPELLSEKLNREYHFNLPLVRRQPIPIHLELHWRLLDPFNPIRFDYPALFGRSRSVAFDHITAGALSDEDNFVYLAAHLDSHGYLNRVIAAPNLDEPQFVLHELSGDRLIWFTDLHELAAKGIDWATVMKRAEAANALAAIRVTLSILKRLLNTPIPEDLLRTVPFPVVTWPQKQLGSYILSLAHDGRSDSPMARFLRRKLLSTRTGFELRLIRLPDLWRYIFPLRATVSENYLAHVCSAAARCGRMLFQLCWRRALRALAWRA